MFYLVTNYKPAV